MAATLIKIPSSTQSSLIFHDEVFFLATRFSILSRTSLFRDHVVPPATHPSPISLYHEPSSPAGGTAIIISHDLLLVYMFNQPPVFL